MVNFGERLSGLRKNIGLSQTVLAKRLGVSASAISEYESGVRFPTFNILIKIAGLFHVTTDYLLGFEKKRTVDVSNLSEEEISVIIKMVELLEGKK